MKEAICNNRADVVGELLVSSAGCMYYRALHTGRKRSVAGTHTDSVSIIEQNLTSSQGSL